MTVSLLMISTDRATSASSAGDSAQNGKLLTCFVYSLQTIPLLQELKLHVRKGATQPDAQDIFKAVGGRDKIQLALLDAEIVLVSLSKLVSEKHVIQLDKKLFENPMWILSNELYNHAMKEKNFKERFLETFEFTQSCIDEFLLQSVRH